MAEVSRKNNQKEGANSNKVRVVNSKCASINYKVN